MSSFNPGSSSSFSTGATVPDSDSNVSHEQSLNEHFGGRGTEGDLFGLRTISLTGGSLAGSALSGALNNERYNKLLKKMQEMAKDPMNDPNALIHVLSLDKSCAPATYFSSIIIATQAKRSPEVGVGVHVLIIDGTNQPLPNMENTINNVAESISRFPEQVWDAQLKEMVKSRVQQLVPGSSKENIFLSAACVIGAETNPDNDQQVFEILSNATLAANSAVAMFAQGGKHFNDLNLVELMRAKQMPELYISHTPATSVVAPDQVGNLSRVSTVTRLTTGKPNKTSTYQPNSGKAATTIMEMGTYTDLIPVAAPQGTPGYQMQYGGGYMAQPAPLMPLVVMSVIRSQFALTPGTSLLALLTVADQVRTVCWASDFRHRGNSVNPGGIDFGDVGAILVNQPDPQNPGQLMPSVTASSPQFSDNHLWELLGRYVRSTPMIGVETPEAGPATWYMGLFTAAAMGNAAAIKRIHDTMNQLTGGAYNQLLAKDPNIQIFMPQVFHVERGYWTVGDKILPLELVDNYVAVCNYARAHGRAGLVNEYVDTIVGSRPQITRLNHKRKILDEMTGGTARYTRSSRRILANNAWVTMGINAMNQAGIVLHSDDSFQFSLSTTQGYAASLQNVQPIGAAMNVAGSGVNYGNNQGNNNYGW